MNPRDAETLAVVIEAIAPNWLGVKIHLHSPNYLPKGIPGRRPKERSVTAPLCGAGFIRREARRVPLQDALRWPEGMMCEDGQVRKRFWCLACLGHAAELLGLTGRLVRGIVWELENRSSEPPLVQGQMFPSASENGSSDVVVTTGKVVGC